MSSYRIRNGNDYITLSGLSYDDKIASVNLDVDVKKEFILAEDVNEIKRSVNSVDACLEQVSETIGNSLQNASNNINQLNTTTTDLRNASYTLNGKISNLSSTVQTNKSLLDNVSFDVRSLSSDLTNVKNNYATKSELSLSASNLQNQINDIRQGESGGGGSSDPELANRVSALETSINQLNSDLDEFYNDFIRS